MQRGFTLLELLVVVMLVGVLAAVTAPMITRTIDQSREAALRQDLAVLRKAIDDYYGDTGRYPPSLDALLEARYIRSIPRDPINDEEGWLLIRTTDGEGVMDVHSQSSFRAADGTSYASW